MQLVQTAWGKCLECLGFVGNKLIDLFSARIPDIMVFGDSNVKLLNINDRNTRCYNDFLKRCKLIKLISTPTRITSQSRTLIDHIVDNTPELFSTFGTMDPGLSDHCLIFTARKEM